MRWMMQKLLQTWEQAEEALCANDGTGGDVEVDSMLCEFALAPREMLE